MAKQSIWAGEKLGQAVVVGDAGLAISALNGFPGPYMKYANQTLTANDLLSMMADKSDRTATFNDCLAYYEPTSQEVKVFLSQTKGPHSDTGFNQLWLLNR